VAYFSPDRIYAWSKETGQTLHSEKSWWFLGNRISKKTFLREKL
jgi:hypothetical protein